MSYIFLGRLISTLIATTTTYYILLYITASIFCHAFTNPVANMQPIFTYETHGLTLGKAPVCISSFFKLFFCLEVNKILIMGSLLFV